ncbi:MAG: ribonuclease P protein component [Geobacter sp.]|nr:ribonuclease P protein component [Geobacter sp.]
MSRPEHPNSFPKSLRLRKRRDYLSVNQQGQRVTASHFIVIRRDCPGGAVRIGITASKKVGGAVVRNRIKRLVRECSRLHKEWFQQADYSLIARSSAARLDFAGVCRDLQRALLKLQAHHG